MPKGGPEVGNTEPLYDRNGNITGYTTPEYKFALDNVFSDVKTETNNVPIYDATFGGGDVLEWVSPAVAEQMGQAGVGAIDGDTGSRVDGVRIGSTPDDDPWGSGSGYLTGADAATGDFDWLDSETGRATHNPGWSFGADGKMYWVGDGPRPSDAEAEAWRNAHLANAGKGTIIGSEGELGLGGIYNSPNPEYDYGDDALDVILKNTADKYVPPRPEVDINYSGPSGTGTVGGQVDVDEAESDVWGGMNSLYGFENSSNVDHYQAQARALRGQSIRNQMREQHSRKVAQEAANAPREEYDPWAWAGGEEVFEPVIGTDKYYNEDGTPADPIMNPNYDFTPGETTNRELLQMFAGTEAMKPYEDNVRAWLAGDPSMDSTGWSNYDPSIPAGERWSREKMLAGDLTPKNREMLNTLFDGMYVQPGDIREFGKPSTPYGYASPLSPTTAAVVAADAANAAGA